MTCQITHPRVDAVAVPAGPRERDAEVLLGPAVEAVVDQPPGHLECVDELGRGSRMVLVVLPSGIHERKAGHRRRGNAQHVANGRVAFTENLVEPVCPASCHVGRQLPDGPVVGRRPQLHLLVGQRTDDVEEAVLVGRPAAVDIGEGRAVG